MVAGLVALFACASLAVSGVPTARAFTLIGVASVTVSPTSGYPTAALKATGKFSPGPCGTPLNFAFFWDTTINFIWSTTVSACDASRNYVAGPSPAYVPPSGFNGVGGHSVIVSVTDANGNPAGPSSSASAAYTIVAPPPPPPPSPKPPSPSPVRSTPPQTQPSAASSPSQSASPDCATGAAAGCPSPTATACAVTGTLPPPGTGGFVDSLIAGAIIAGGLAIGMVALVGPGALLAAAIRQRRLLGLLGLAVLVALTLACGSVVGNVPDVTPSATATAPASPTC